MFKKTLLYRFSILLIYLHILQTQCAGQLHPSSIHQVFNPRISLLYAYSHKPQLYRPNFTLAHYLIHESSLHDARIFHQHPLGCNPRSVKEIAFFKTPFYTTITILQDRLGKKFLVKQNTRFSVYWRLVVARDKLGAQIAQSCNILANHVDIIPAHCFFPGKRNILFPATLHTFVPGIIVKDLPLNSPIFQGTIQQHAKKGMPYSQRGLTRNVIMAMAQHPDLPKIVALDTFIANADRHSDNFIYDPATDHFIAIDLENAFSNNLGAYACSLITSLINDENTSLCQQELNALQIYKNTLELLLASYTPQQLYEMLISYAQESGALARSLLEALMAHIQDYQKTISANYDSCKKLVELLEQLFIQHKEISEIAPSIIEKKG